MPVDGQNGQKVLDALDYLSARYCSTIGYSVLNGDYEIRTPNTADGLEPSESNPIIGGIFQGASSTQNHEIWERLLMVMREYSIEFEGKIHSFYAYGTPGGTGSSLFYNIENPPSAYIRYTNKEHSKLACGSSKYLSSINGENRSIIDVLISYGYIATSSIQGAGS